MGFPKLVFALLFVPLFAAAQGGDSLAGAWEQTAVKNMTTGEAQQLVPPALHVLYSNGQYVRFRAAANRTKTDTPRDKMTLSELLERSNMQGQYGTYRVAGNKLTRNTVSAADPNNEGREFVAEFKIDGDNLIVVGPNLQGQSVETRFRRLR